MVCGTKPNACDVVCKGKGTETECMGCMLKMKKLKADCSICLKTGKPPAATAPKAAPKAAPAPKATPAHQAKAKVANKELDVKKADKKHLKTLQAQLLKLKKEEAEATA